MGATVLVMVVDEKWAVHRCGEGGDELVVGGWSSRTWWVSSW